MTGLAITIGVFVLGAIGAAIRLLFARWGNESIGGWPLGTLSVNVVASFALGVIHVRFGDAGTAIGVGLLGALSTWSTLALEVMDRIRSGRWTTAAGYLTVTVTIGIAAAWAGMQM